IADTVAGEKLVRPCLREGCVVYVPHYVDYDTRRSLDQHDIVADDHATIARRKRAQLSLQVLWQTSGLELRRRPTVARRERIELRGFPPFAAPKINPDHRAIEMRDARLNDAGGFAGGGRLTARGHEPPQSREQCQP